MTAKGEVQILVCPDCGEDMDEIEPDIMYQCLECGTQAEQLQIFDNE